MADNTINTLKPHISLNVKNIAASVEFYQKLFGIDPLKFIPAEKGNGRGGYAKFDVEHPPLNLALNEVPYTPGGGLSHLGIQVAASADVLELRERWHAAGLTTVDEMNTDCCYALQDKAWARDPDGNEWEAFVVLADTQPTGDACAAGTRLAAQASTICCTPGEKFGTADAVANSCC